MINASNSMHPFIYKWQYCMCICTSDHRCVYNIICSLCFLDPIKGLWISWPFIFLSTTLISEVQYFPTQVSAANFCVWLGVCRCVCDHNGIMYVHVMSLSFTNKYCQSPYLCVIMSTVCLFPFCACTSILRILFQIALYGHGLLDWCMYDMILYGRWGELGAK